MLKSPSPDLNDPSKANWRSTSFPALPFGQERYSGQQDKAPNTKCPKNRSKSALYFLISNSQSPIPNP